MITAHIIYSGRVQGVGFRFTTLDLAQQYGLTGWVKNLPSGQVEVWVVGEEQIIKAFCKELEDFFKGHIADQTISYEERAGKFKDFQIAY